jgi:hypothetical protein
MLAIVRDDPNAIGFAPLAATSKDVKVITINGVAMTRATVLSGRYPLARLCSTDLRRLRRRSS